VAREGARVGLGLGLKSRLDMRQGIWLIGKLLETGMNILNEGLKEKRADKVKFAVRHYGPKRK
jgi:hypothetical protein